MTSNPHGPYEWGFTCVTMDGTMSRNEVTRSQSPKPSLIRISCLQFDRMKPELLVIVDQHRYGESVLELCTYCPSRHGTSLCLK